MRLFLIALAVMLLTASAQARGTKGNQTGTTDQATTEKKKKAEEVDKLYKATIDGIPDQKFDPWGGIRSPQSKPQK